MENAMAGACSMFTNADSQNVAHCVLACTKALQLSSAKGAGKSVAIDVGSNWAKAGDAMAAGHVVGKVYTDVNVHVINQFYEVGDANSGGSFTLDSAAQNQVSDILVAFAEINTNALQVGNFVVASKAAAKSIRSLEAVGYRAGTWHVFVKKAKIAFNLAPMVGTYVEDLKAIKQTELASKGSGASKSFESVGKLVAHPHGTSEFSIEWFEVKERAAVPVLAKKPMYSNPSPYTRYDVVSAFKRGDWVEYKP